MRSVVEVLELRTSNTTTGSVTTVVPRGMDEHTTNATG
jgi:hypothetical protein